MKAVGNVVGKEVEETFEKALTDSARSNRSRRTIRLVPAEQLRFEGAEPLLQGLQDWSSDDVGGRGIRLQYFDEPRVPLV